VIHSRRPRRLALVLATAALVALLVAATAGAQTAVRQPNSTRPACKLVSKAGHKVVRVCKRKVSQPDKATPEKATTPENAATSPVTSSPAAATASTVAPDPPVTTPDPPVVTPPEPPVVTTGPTEVKAVIGAGFSQNPLVPNEVTWHYSASATHTVTTDGVAQTETAALPEGELAFFIDGKLECEIHAVGAISGSTCTTVLKTLGAHEVETIFQAATASDTAVRTDYVNKYPTSTNVQVSVEPVPPEYLDIGPNAYGFEQYAFEIGRVRITGSVSPGFYPTFDCEGQPVGCLIPEAGSLASHRGTVTLPLYSQHRRNAVTEREEWHVGFDAYSPALRESGDFWQFPDESVGTQFFHLVGEPAPALYVPSEVTVPLDLRGGHYPFYREVKMGEGGGSIAGVEGTMTKVLTLGTYDKLGGTEHVLKFSGKFNNKTGESEGCRYQPRVDGQGLGEHRAPAHDWFEVMNGFYGLPPGPHTFELWVERQAGAGPGNCQITTGHLEASEVIHATET
jgi:hypothetical protein